MDAKPAGILGVLYPELAKAVVHNDFVSHWQERAVAMNLYHPGGHQIVPGMFQWFDYTDLEAALAPRPLLFTEGERPNQIAKIRRAYTLMGEPEAPRVYHYEKMREKKMDSCRRLLVRLHLPVVPFSLSGTLELGTKPRIFHVGSPNLASSSDGLPIAKDPIRRRAEAKRSSLSLHGPF